MDLIPKSIEHPSRIGRRSELQREASGKTILYEHTILHRMLYYTTVQYTIPTMSYDTLVGQVPELGRARPDVGGLLRRRKAKQERCDGSDCLLFESVHGS